MVINLGIDGAVRKSPFGLVIYTADTNCQIIAPLAVPFLYTPFHILQRWHRNRSKRKRGKKMRKRHILLYIVAILLGLITINNNVSALSYSTDVNIGFTFNPTISLSISPDSLTILNLTPGTATESNTITVNVATNTAYGYHLTANVGSDTTNYNTTNLVHASSASSIPTSNTTFTSLAYGASVANKDNLFANTWGYSYSNDSGTTWQPYSGLPLYSDTSHSTELISTYDPADSKSIDFKIAASAGNTQPSGEYTNVINFYAVANSGPPLLYDLVEDMTKGTLAQNNVNLSDSITQANSGVYTYDPTVYGAASDASNDYHIYFYRGILDTDAGLGTYGSDGQADAWPNYVKLNNGTCWRIVRTTGSGGVKMIYNGMYGATTAGSCANATVNAQTTTKAFNAGSNIGTKSIIAVGYTFNSNYKTTTEDTAYGLLFGTNENYSGNITDSTIKDYLENTWFPNAMNSYESRLEPSAGYCNDRSIRSILQNDDVVFTPYSLQSSGVVFYSFGNTDTLTCWRSVVDLYSAEYSNSGNRQLDKPVALLTKNEAFFAGVGYRNNSFLRSGSYYWLFSPMARNQFGNVFGSLIYDTGQVGGSESYGMSGPYGVRPVISLMHHIQVTSGSGTATSPWTIE